MAIYTIYNSADYLSCNLYRAGDLYLSQSPDTRSHVIYCYLAATGWWTITNALELVFVDIDYKLFSTQASYFAITALPALWLVFALRYTGKSPFHIGWLFVEPAITVILVWTNTFHHLFYTDVYLEYAETFVGLTVQYGAFFWVHALYSYTLLLWGLVLLARVVFRSSRIYQGQAATVLAGLLMPWAANAVLFGRLESFSLS